MQNIQDYQIEKRLGKGGMGEVFLAKDPICPRLIALKIIREEMRASPIMRKRFLQEAKIAAKLTHPGIVSIYQIYEGEDALFYTMPYIQGETLKEILKKTKEEQRNGKILHPIGASIPSLLRIFLNICEAIAYSHNQGVIHRDLKPDNIIIGEYGETLILDWGLACLCGENDELSLKEYPASNGLSRHSLTRPGKVPGTLSYMPPERALGDKATVSTDIYALGVILYQLLTLRLPFHRRTLPLFRKNAHLEKIHDPSEIAPYRDIPPFLSDITKKCLSFDPKERYCTVERLSADIKTYIEGKPHWMAYAVCHINQQEDWLFQELIPKASHTAVSTSLESVEWILVMLAKASLRGNFCLNATITFQKPTSEFSFILNTPEATLQSAMGDSFILTFSTQSKGCVLYQQEAVVLESALPSLEQGIEYNLCIEKIDHHLFVYLNDAIVLDYLSHFPMTGEHFGVLCKNFNFTLSAVTLSSGTQRTMVSCLSIPDAFLAKNDYSTALLEYQKLAQSFEGRSEGREALFRAGLTLLKQAKEQTAKQKKEIFFVQALEEFGKLRKSSGAPMEYLGKSLVYEAWNEPEEEIKCLELSLRKYGHHPLIDLIADQIYFRLHQSSSKNRLQTLNFALLAIRLLPNQFLKSHNLELLASIEKTLESQKPLLPHLETSTLQIRFELLTILLALTIHKPIVLLELIEKSEHITTCENALFALLHMGSFELAEEVLSEENSKINTPFFKDLILSKLKTFPEETPSSLTISCLILFFKHHLEKSKPSLKILQGLLEQVPETHDNYYLKALCQNAQVLLADDPITAVDNSKLPIFLCHLSHMAKIKGPLVAIESLEKTLQSSSDETSFSLMRILTPPTFFKEISILHEKGIFDDLLLISLHTFAITTGNSKLSKAISSCWKKRSPPC